jgi:hypothetical protein
LRDVEAKVAQCSESDRQAIFVACQIVAMADGRVWREANVLDHIGDVLGLSKKLQTRIAREIRKQPKRKCPAPQSEAGKQLMFHFAAKVASADGRLDVRERKVVQRLGKYLGIARDQIEAELAVECAKPEREVRRQRNSFLEAADVEPGHRQPPQEQLLGESTPGVESSGIESQARGQRNDTEDSLEDLLSEVRTPSEHDVYHRLLLHSISESGMSRQVGLHQVGCWATASLLWSLFFGGILALLRMSSHREPVAETVFTIFVVLGFVMMIPPGLAYWFRTRSDAGRRSLVGDAEVRISGVALAPGSELHVEFIQPNRSGSTLRDVTLRLELVRHVAREHLNRTQTCQPYGADKNWPEVWHASRSFDFSTVDADDSLRGVCQFSLPDRMTRETPFTQWWGINSITKVAPDADVTTRYSETFRIPSRHGVGCVLSTAGVIVGAIAGFLTVWLVGGLLLRFLIGPVVSIAAYFPYVLLMFLGIIGGGIAGRNFPKLFGNKTRTHPAMASFALPGAFGIAVCVLSMMVGLRPALVSLPASQSAPSVAVSKTQPTKSQQGTKSQQLLMKQYQRTILFGTADDVRQILTSHPELIERRLTVNRWINPTALHYCALHGKRVVAKVLLELGANPDVRSSRGRTPLHDCARHGKLDAAKVLLELGANPDARSSRGRTPLHSACGWKRPLVVRLLLEYGADVWLKDADGLTARRYAELNKNDPEKRAEIFRILDEHVAQLEQEGQARP